MDLGGGDGLLLDLLQDRGFSSLKLLDISSVAVAKARDKGLDAEVFDITSTLPFEDKSFGTVCALDVLEHLFDPLSLLKEMGRVGREVVVAVPNFCHWRDRIRFLLGRVPESCRPHRGHVYWFNYSILRRLSEEAGLNVDKVLFPESLRFGRLGNLFSSARPDLFAYSVAARLK